MEMTTARARAQGHSETANRALHAAQRSLASPPIAERAPSTEDASGVAPAPRAAGRPAFQFGDLPILPKLTVSEPGDALEIEADQVADRVMRMAEPASAPPIAASPDGTTLRRKCAGCEDDQLQRQAEGAPSGRTTAPPIVHDVLRSPGRPLDPATRAYMEPRFGHDFGRIRVHADADAAASARAVGALAYTVGPNIVFSEGRYAPASGDGRRLLAHELAHTLQQASGVGSRLARQAGPPAPAGGLSSPMVEQIARDLYQAMEGWGTDEDAIYAALSGRTTDQVDAIAARYAAMYAGHTLIADLQDELTDSEMRRLATLAPRLAGGTIEPASERTFRAEVVSQQLRDAMAGWGTNESAIFSALTGRTPEERQAIKTAYQALTSRTLESDLRDELSGSDLTRALALLNDGLLQPEDELYLAMVGLGTDEATIFRVLEGMASDPAGILAMEQRYRQKYGDLVEWLRDDLSGRDYARAMRVLRPVIQDAAFEDCTPGGITTIRSAVATAITKVDHAVTVVNGGRASWTPAQTATFAQYFDPSGAGYDDGFVRDVASNFRSVRRALDQPTFECETAGGQCAVANRYGYTMWGNIHICPYYFTMGASSQTMGVIHELTHNALTAVDRPYYSSAAGSGYSQLTPRGIWANQIPVLGPLIRLISRSDTLYAPDAYAYFAINVT